MRSGVICKGKAQGEAFVVGGPLSFIGDFNPETGNLSAGDGPLYCKVLKNKILVCTTGKGGTMTPFIAYTTKQKGTATAAIITEKA
jgi:predicted aconitase with swiveling domain